MLLLVNINVIRAKNLRGMSLWKLHIPKIIERIATITSSESVWTKNDWRLSKYLRNIFHVPLCSPRGFQFFVLLEMISGYCLHLFSVLHFCSIVTHFVVRGDCYSSLNCLNLFVHVYACFWPSMSLSQRSCNSRTIERPELEGTLKITQFQRTCHGQNGHPPHEAAQGPIQHPT